MTSAASASANAAVTIERRSGGSPADLPHTLPRLPQRQPFELVHGCVSERQGDSRCTVR